MPNFPRPRPLPDPDCSPWAEALRRAARVLVVSDFDGTLAPIAARPGQVRPAPGAAPALAALAALPGWRVALVSGRRRDDLRRLLPVVGAMYIGGHGNEPDPELGWPPPPAMPGDLAPLLAARLTHWPGAWLEPKAHSLAVHYRQAPQWGPDIVAWAQAQARARGWRCLSGRMAVELLAPGALDKGVAVRRLREQYSPELSFYFGDDGSDETVFASSNDGLIGVRVGAADVATAAPWRLSGPARVVRYLACLAKWRNPPSNGGAAAVG